MLSAIESFKVEHDLSIQVNMRLEMVYGLRNARFWNELGSWLANSPSFCRASRISCLDGSNPVRLNLMRQTSVATNLRNAQIFDHL